MSILEVYSVQTYIVGARGGAGVGIMSLHAHAVLCQQCAKVGGKRGMEKEKNTTSSGDDFTKNIHSYILQLVSLS